MQGVDMYKNNKKKQKFKNKAAVETLNNKQSTCVFVQGRRPHFSQVRQVLNKETKSLKWMHS